MTRVHVVFAMALACAAGGDLSACGDKFRLGARYTPLLRALGGDGTASVLIYQPPSAATGTMVVNQDAARVLRKDGYAVTVVTSPIALRRALDARPWLLVLVDAADVREVGITHLPRVLPVLHRPTREALAEARRSHAVALSAPLKNQAFLDAIGDVIEQRIRLAARGTARAR